ncbi:MAG: aldose 1-epimerase family protein [Lachnospiraceae bacterium]|nr:aldose 1-epimerase family protein [Lachnospiraceae bacterium]
MKKAGGANDRSTAADSSNGAAATGFGAGKAQTETGSCRFGNVGSDESPAAGILGEGGRKRLLRLCGSIEQVASVRRVTFEDGRAAGLRCALVKNGPLEFALMLDKCLDPAWLSYKGMGLTLLTKPGLQGRNPYDTAGEEAVRSIMGGAMFTCGFENIHGCQTIDGVEYPTHGRIRTTPAEKVGMDAFFEGDTYKLRVSGEMREARIFGENLVLRRRVESVYGSREIVFTDEVENQGFEPQPFCLLYHCNAGYPLLEPGARLILPEKSCMPRDEAAEKGMETRKVMGEPKDGEAEQVFQCVPAADPAGNTFAAVVNDRLSFGLCIRWNVGSLPYMTLWKSGASGDYAMAMEPTNCGFSGRAGKTEMLKAMEKRVYRFSISVLDGKEELERIEKEASACV